MAMPTFAFMMGSAVPTKAAAIRQPVAVTAAVAVHLVPLAADRPIAVAHHRLLRRLILGAFA